MYRKIMVPLDGSELGETVLPHVEAVAGGCGAAEVVFVRVTERFERLTGFAEANFSDEEIRSINQDRQKLAGSYLDEVIGRLNLGGVSLKAAVLTGKPADKITEYATEAGADLIIIATHGNSGVSRWAWGSVAERVLHAACVPVLMVRPPTCVPKL